MRKKNFNSDVINNIITIVSIVIAVFTLIFVENYSVILANLGIEKNQFEVADEARMFYDFPTALKYYDKILQKGEENSPYAALAKLEIITEVYNDIADVDEVINYFIIASQSYDVSVLKSCFYFLITQFDLKLLNGKYSSKLLSKENTEYIVSLFNKLNSLDKTFFIDTGINFPVDRAEINAILSKDAKKTMDEWHWEYVSTIDSLNPGLATESENEKIVYAYQEERLLCPTTVDMVSVYTYWKYKKVIDKKNDPVPILDILLEKQNNTKPIYFSKRR